MTITLHNFVASSIMNVVEHRDTTFNVLCNLMDDVAAAYNILPAHVTPVYTKLKNLENNLQGLVYKTITESHTESHKVSFEAFAQGIWNALISGNTLFYNEVMFMGVGEHRWEAQYSNSLLSSIPGTAVLSFENNFRVSESSMYTNKEDIEEDSLYEGVRKAYEKFITDPAYMATCFGYLPFRFPNTSSVSPAVSHDQDVFSFVVDINQARINYDSALDIAADTTIIEDAEDQANVYKSLQNISNTVARHLYNAMMDILYSYNKPTRILLPEFKAYSN